MPRPLPLDVFAAARRLQLSSFFGVDLCTFSEGQPMQIMAKDSKVCVGPWPHAHESHGRDLAHAHTKVCKAMQGMH